MLLKALFVSLFSAFVTALDYPSRDQYCFVGCQEVLAYVQFGGPPEATEENYYDVHCQNALLVEPVYLCARAHLSAPEVNAGWE